MEEKKSHADFAESKAKAALKEMVEQVAILNFDLQKCQYKFIDLNIAKKGLEAAQRVRVQDIKEELLEAGDIRDELALKDKKIRDLKEIHLKEVEIYKEKVNSVKVEYENIQMREEEYKSHIQRQKDKLMKYDKRHKEDRDDVDQMSQKYSVQFFQC